jgi:hypothetical protein
MELTRNCKVHKGKLHLLQDHLRRLKSLTIVPMCMKNNTQCMLNITKYADVHSQNISMKIQTGTGITLKDYERYGKTAII